MNALVPFASAVLGSLVGGGISGLVARATLRETHRLSREDDQRVRERASATALATAVARALSTLPGGAESQDHRDAVSDLAVATASNAPVLRDHGVEARVELLLELLRRDPGLAARLEQLDGGHAARVAERTNADQLAYGAWVQKSLAAVVRGDKPPLDLPGPAPLHEPDAPPWSAT